MAGFTGRPRGGDGSEAAWMVEKQVRARGVRDPRVLASLREVPRHLFVPSEEREIAYSDQALPIGEGQTISQPYIVALMTELLSPRPGDRILEVGTGSGYQAAILASLGAEVFSLEIVPGLARRAEDRLARLGFRGIRVRTGDGSSGWPEEAPFDGIMVTCAAGAVPEPLAGQLKEGGKMVIPLGKSLSFQDLTVATRLRGGKLGLETVTGVVFVPMTGPRGLAGNRE